MLLDDANFNTREGKIAKEVSLQFISKKVGRPIKNGLREEVNILLRLCSEIDNGPHADALSDMCESVDINNDNACARISVIGESISTDEDQNWGRLVATYAFAAKLAEQCKECGNEDMIENIITWLSCYVARKTNWIRNTGRGWNGFIEQYGTPAPGPPPSPEDSWFRGIFTTTITLGTLAAALYIKNS